MRYQPVTGVCLVNCQQGTAVLTDGAGLVHRFTRSLAT